MARFLRLFGSTVGKKYIVGLSGAALVVFIITHLLGNFSLFGGATAFNDYAHALEGLPGFRFIELSLAGLFLVHIGATMSLARENRQARDEKYEGGNNAPTRMGSMWMVPSGIIILAFLVTHLKTLRFGDYSGLKGGLYELTMDSMGTPAIGILYIVGVALLGLHLSHGIQALFRTLGFSDEGHMSWIQIAGRGLALLLTLGFITFPILAMIKA